MPVATQADGEREAKAGSGNVPSDRVGSARLAGSRETGYRRAVPSYQGNRYGFWVGTGDSLHVAGRGPAPSSVSSGFAHAVGRGSRPCNATHPTPRRHARIESPPL